jgi:hypothetical protein
MKQKVLATLLLSAVTALAGPNAAALVSVDMDPATAGIQDTFIASDTGETFTVDIVVDTVTNCLGADLVFNVDPAQIEYAWDTMGTIFTIPMPTQVGADSVMCTYVRVPPSISAADVVLCSITFKANVSYDMDVPITLRRVSLGSDDAIIDDVTGAVTPGTYGVPPLMHRVNVSSEAGGSVDPTSIDVEHGTVSDTIRATPDSCHTFNQWTVVMGNITVLAPSSAATTIGVNGGGEIRASYTVKQYTLTVTDDGNAESTTGGGTVDCGVASAISATPDSHYTFLNWTVTAGTAVFADSTAASTEVTISGDATVQATFALDVHTLTVNAGSNGSVSPSGDQPVEHGDSVEVVATPDSGYEFVCWSVEAGSGNVAIEDDSAATTSIVVTGDATVEASFDVRSAVSSGSRVPSRFSLAATADGVLVQIPGHWSGPVVIRLLDVGGHLVRTYVAANRAGRRAIRFDTGERPVSSGYYLCCMRAGTFSETVKVCVGR